MIRNIKTIGGIADYVQDNVISELGSSPIDPDGYPIFYDSAQKNFKDLCAKSSYSYSQRQELGKALYTFAIQYSGTMKYHIIRGLRKATITFTY